MKHFSIVVAMDEKNGIGKNGDLAWRLSADLKHFKEVTSKTNDSSKRNVVIMGRKTWDSLPEKFKPLPNRLNVILSRNLNVHVQLKGAVVFANLDEALRKIDDFLDTEQIFVIGGAQLYAQAIHHPACQKLFITYLKGIFSCDVFFPAIPNSFKLKQESLWAKEGSLEYRFCQYIK